MSITKNYRVDGRDDYTVSYTQQRDGTYKIHCSRHPPNPQSRRVDDCHLYSNGNVCVAAGKEPRTLDKAIAIGLVFCQGYSKYVRTGIFPNGRQRVNV